MKGMGRRWVLLVFVAACGGPDPLLGFREIFDAVDAGEADVTVEDDACFCFDAAAPDVGVPPPPPVLCPPTAPLAGEPCTVPPYENCEYGMTGSFFCDTHFLCLGGQWRSSTYSCDTPQSCDGIADGGACTSPGQSCGFADADSVCVCSACGGGPPPPPPPPDAGMPPPTGPQWRCFTPPPECGVSRANSGTSCDLPDGSVCSFAGGGCCIGVVEQCSDGVWLGQPTEPCP